jgi:hypothetical protein
MFGYLVYSPDNLNDENRRIYKECYCGLCKCLDNKYGALGRSTVSYDLAFIAMLFTAIYGPQNVCGEERCPVHPVRKHGYWYNEYSEFAADMNMLLTYYKYLDDFADDNDRRRKKIADKMQEYIDEIEKRYPEQCSIIRKCLEDNAEMERQNVTNPDIPANCFGTLFAQVFTYKNDEYTPALQQLGFHLGKFIYLMDAYMDFRDDLNKQRYNPLVTIDLKNMEDILETVMADCIKAYNTLPIDDKYREILDNVLYAGVWSEYDVRTAKERKKK